VEYFVSEAPDCLLAELLHFQESHFMFFMLHKLLPLAGKQHNIAPHKLTKKLYGAVCGYNST
jgi:hypothetical protein